MELISLDTLIKVYEEYSFSKEFGVHVSNKDIKELVEYCNSVKDYLSSVNSKELEFYEGMLKHNNFLDRMVTLLYILDDMSYNNIFKHIINNNIDYILIKKINNNEYRSELEEAYYNVFKNEIIAKKRNDILNQIL